ncbi:MAG: MBL fold metallo-hydrolase [Rhodospirillaceae bacterium]|nr:MAG: MBL fold metallo-hydrolase [Rhodospirillaceae bacterium]
MAIPWVKDLDFEYAVVQTVSPLIRRVVARNPGPFTAQGTGTYIVGHGQVAVIDPGPLLAEHIEALLSGLRGETVTHLLVTHTHRDHSPAAAPVKQATGASTYGYGPHAAGIGPASEEGGDQDFSPDQRIIEGESVSGKGWRLNAVHTPGHTSNHLCYALEEEKILFTGDHVMGWSTTIVAPPDGNMTDYMHSLERLLEREDTLYLPTHGPGITDPHTHVRALIAHRQKRHDAILRALADGSRTIPEIVKELYVGLDPRLRVAAGYSVLAHLVEMVRTGEASTDGPPSIEAIYHR